MDNLYVHLQSDSSPEFFPNNTICDFRNQLAGSLDVDPSYFEVALVQCSYVYNPPSIKAGKEVARLRVIGPVTDFCDTVQRTEHIFHTENVVSTNTFMLTEEDLFRYKEKDFVNIRRITDLKSIHNEATDIYRITENTIECCLEHSIETFEDLLKCVNDKLSKYQTNIEYDSNGNKIVKNLHSSVHFVEFMGTYVKVFEQFGTYRPHDWFDANKVNIKQHTILFRMHVTSKIEQLGANTHTHDLPSDLKIIETIEENISASKYYGNDMDGSLMVQTSLYHIHLDEDVYDVDGLITQLNLKIPSILFKYENNIITFEYTENIHNFYILETSDQIKAILGMTETNSIYTPETKHYQQRGTFRPFFGCGQQKMFIYADIIENQFIGSQLAPLLRITDYKGQNATTTTQEFAHHHYVPLRNINLDQIHMYIRSETSDYLPIELGTFSATLHFRRKRF